MIRPTLGFQAQLSGPPRQGDTGGSRVLRGSVHGGRDGGGVSGGGVRLGDGECDGVFLAGARSAAAMAEALAPIHDAIRAEVGYD